MAATTGTETIAMDRIKELVRRYNQAHKATAELTEIKKELVPLLKRAGLTATKFNFGDRSLSYSKYYAMDGPSQKLIKQYLYERHPNINADVFVTDLYAMRQRKLVETIKIDKKQSAATRRQHSE